MQPRDFDRDALLRTIGVPSETELPAGMLDDVLEILCAAMQPRVIWRMFPLSCQATSLYLKDIPLEGKDIARHLTGCHAAVVLAVTLSAAVDAQIRKLQTIHMTRALLLDAAACEAVELLCESVERTIRARNLARYYTARFSAGYGDFPLTAQGGLLRLVDAQRTIGVTLTASHLLLPMKSVTALIGLSNAPVQDARKAVCGVSCEGCPRYDTCPARQSSVS